MLDVKQRLLLGERRRPRVWTVEFLPNSSIGIRRDLARGLLAGVGIGTERVRNDFDRIPIFQRPIFNATWNRVTRRWVDPVPMGAPRFSWTPIEPYREVVYRCRPFWYSLDMSAAYAPLRISVSDRPLSGFVLAPMFQNGRDFVYRPCFEMGIGEDGLPHSRAGLLPVRADLQELMQHARGYDAQAQTESIKDWFSDVLLQLVEFARWDFFSVMGGNTPAEIAECGVALSQVAATVGSPETGSPCVWRGKENPWKNANSALCDVLLRKTVVDGENVIKLFYLDGMQHYDGTLNSHYCEVGPFIGSSNGSRDIYGFSMGPGFFYPLPGKQTGVVIKGTAYQYADSEATPLNVAVGGASSTAMLSTSVRPSPLNFECVATSNWRAKHMGARLILNEGRK